MSRLSPELRKRALELTNKRTETMGKSVLSEEELFAVAYLAAEEMVEQIAGGIRFDRRPMGPISLYRNLNTDYSYPSLDQAVRISQKLTSWWDYEEKAHQEFKQVPYYITFTPLEVRSSRQRVTDKRNTPHTVQMGFNPIEPTTSQRSFSPK